ncbi:MAG: hypothetical protein JXA77_05355 [Bacteroidales bacterium]|nr:hypothetical protein [Bacteroidales bacterium]MBN2819729.1 hypothetical protein [Bacteroidales bacterium]
MKKTILNIVILCLLFGSISYAQDEEKKFGIEFSGFVKNDFFYDSRQTVNAREGHFLLWPTPENIDALGSDINATPNFNFLSIQSRLSGKITGPDAFGAKTSGVIEGDFFAQANDNINLFRMRHAFLKLNWSNTELITGQTWNPLFVTGCFPGTVSFNTGTPLQSFARNPQIRVTQTLGGIKVMGAILGQRDYTSRGANGISSEYLRNAVLPDLHFQVQYELKNEAAGASFLAGAGIAYKTIVPRIYSQIEITAAYDTVDQNGLVWPVKAVTEKYKVDEKVSGLTAIVFTKLVLKPVTIKLQYRYGENIADVLSISGFAVKDVVDPITREQSYTPIKNKTIWGEIHTNGKKIQAGLFAGVLKNNGTKEAMSNAGNSIYGLGTQTGTSPGIESLLRISPRIIFISNKTKIAFEIEYTSAVYGADYDVNYIASTTHQVSNTRFLLSTIYSF